MQDGRTTYRSREINVNSFCEELSSSERAERPVETDVIQTRSSEDRKSLNVQQTHERTERLVATLNTADAKDTRVRSSHESDTFNVEDEELRMKVQLLLCQLTLFFSISTQEPPFAIPVRNAPCISQCLSRPNFASQNSVLGDTQKLLLLDHDDQHRFLYAVRLANELTPLSPILRNQTFSPNCAIGFLPPRPVLRSSLVFPSLPILILFMI